MTSLGIGGTNAHVVLEEARRVEEPAAPKNPYQLLVLSAKTASALDKASQNLRAHLQEHPGLPLQDAACTLQLGRKAFVHRRTVVAATTEEAVKLLAQPEPSRVFTGQAAPSAPGVVFMFSGQGSQYVNMGRELYADGSCIPRSVRPLRRTSDSRSRSRLAYFVVSAGRRLRSSSAEVIPYPFYAARVVQHGICAGKMVDGARNRAFRNDRPQHRRVRGCLSRGCVLA